MTRYHKDWIHDFVSTIAPRSEAPERYLYWSAVAAIGGAIRRRCYIDMGQFKWYPNWFIVLVGPPGLVKKSTTVDVALKLLREVPGVNFGPDVSTWEGFVSEVANAKDVFAAGGTTANLMEQNYEATSALTMAISEWGTFLDPNNYIMINVLTDFWDCKDTEWRKSTKTQGTDVVVAPFVNMIAGTTPQWMLQNFRGQFGGWGFSSRCIFLYAGEPTRSIPYPDELWGEEIHSWQATFITDLRAISELEGPFTLHPAARELGKLWYTEHQARIRSFALHPNSDPWTGYYLARKQTHAHKLALCLAAGRRSDRVILREDLQEALDKCNDIEDELAYIFGKRAFQTRDVKLNLDAWNGISKQLDKHGRIRERDVFKFTIEYMTFGRAKEMLENLKRARLLSMNVDDRGESWLVRGDADADAELIATAQDQWIGIDPNATPAAA